MKTVFIYALCEPGTRKVRYIGMTVNLKRRLGEHCKKSLVTQTPLGEWLRRLEGRIPNMIKLCETSEAFWQDEETRYIRAARALGMPLVNSTDGGEGCCNPSSESRAKMSAAARNISSETRALRSSALAGEKHPGFGKHPSPETCALMSAAHSGENNSMFGEHHSPEARAKQSAKALARYVGPEGQKLRLKLSAARKGKPWPAAMRATYERKKAGGG